MLQPQRWSLYPTRQAKKNFELVEKIFKRNVAALLIAGGLRLEALPSNVDKFAFKNLFLSTKNLSTRIFFSKHKKNQDAHIRTRDKIKINKFCRHACGRSSQGDELR